MSHIRWIIMKMFTKNTREMHLLKLSLLVFSEFVMDMVIVIVIIMSPLPSLLVTANSVYWNAQGTSNLCLHCCACNGFSQTSSRVLVLPPGSSDIFHLMALVFLMDVVAYTVQRKLHTLKHTHRVYSLCVDYQSVPLSFDVILRWLFCDIKTIKFQLPGHLLFTLKDHQWHLHTQTHTCTPI